MKIKYGSGNISDHRSATYRAYGLGNRRHQRVAGGNPSVFTRRIVRLENIIQPDLLGSPHTERVFTNPCVGCHVNVHVSDVAACRATPHLWAPRWTQVADCTSLKADREIAISQTQILAAS
jgi:hypothetical protein